MIAKELREYLDAENVRYSVISHSPAFTAQDVASAARIPGKEVAKTVIVRADDRLIMVVLPASEMVNFRTLRKVLGASKVELATEDEFRDTFGECELGAMPPFGNLYRMEVLVASDLAEDEQIAFNAGSHRELVRMAYRDFERLVHPRLAVIGVRRRAAWEDRWEYDG